MFKADEFIDTKKWDTAKQKARFANHFVRFVESGYKWTLFHKWFYTRLSLTFGHIAHYNRSGFYDTFFTNEKDIERFLAMTLNHPCYGQPEYTYCDVEKALITWLKDWIYVNEDTQLEMKL